MRLTVTIHSGTLGALKFVVDAVQVAKDIRGLSGLFSRRSARRYARRFCHGDRAEASDAADPAAQGVGDGAARALSRHLGGGGGTTAHGGGLSVRARGQALGVPDTGWCTFGEGDRTRLAKPSLD
ncbi:MAG TPA: hypothetical protein VFC19_12495 [Candidatus Limnocylindrales bacterium]|nr:hypothetical protein [Candidatus Limnocylindrales bacterium]